MNLIPKSSEHLERVGKSIDLTNKLLRDIDNRIATIDDNYMVLIPDSNFRNYLEENHSISFDESFVVYSQIKHISEINFSERSVKLHIENPIISLSGLQYFTSLEKLVIADGDTTKLDVSNNVKLSFLDCSGNPLTTLDLSKNVNLTHLDCSCTQLHSIDVSKNINLEKFICSGNEYKSLNLSTNIQLTYLDCSNGAINTLNFHKNDKLQTLKCGINKIESLDLSEITNLTLLDCYFAGLTNLDLSKNIHLQELICGMNRLENLDTSKNTELSYLECGANLLTNIDVSKNTSLTKLHCSKNQFINIDVTKNFKLVELECCDNKITHLDISKNIQLTQLNSCRNELSNIDLTNNINLQKVQLSGNPGNWWIELEKEPYVFWNSLDQNWQKFLLLHVKGGDYPDYDMYTMIPSYTYEDYLYGPSLESLEAQNELAFKKAVITWLSSISENDIIAILNLLELGEDEYSFYLKDMSPILKFKNLSKIIISCHFIDFTLFSHLPNLEYIDIRIMRPPFKWGCQNKHHDDCAISNLNPLSNLIKLSTLKLSFFCVLDFECLSNLHNLELLELEYNNITDVSPLLKIITANQNLDQINFSNNLISDISPLLKLDNANNKFYNIDLSNNLISDISPLFVLPQDTKMFINLYANPIDPNQLSAFEQSHPNLHLIY